MGMHPKLFHSSPYSLFRQAGVDYIHKFKIKHMRVEGKRNLWAIIIDYCLSSLILTLPDRVSGGVCLIKEMIGVPLKCVIYLVITF